MTANATLEKTVVEDTLFGDPQVRSVELGQGPDGDCLCTCGCLTRDARSTNSQLTSASASVSVPFP